MEKTIYDSILEQIKDIDTTDLDNSVDQTPISFVSQEQIIYFWIRLYLKEEDPNLTIGDNITIRYNDSGEELKTIFSFYGKTGLEKDHDEELINYTAEDDQKIICLMIDEKTINTSDDIPFIRTLFKTGRFYEYQLVKRDELTFTNDKNGILLDYFDCDF